MCLLQFFQCYPSQADAIYNMVGYPDFIMNATKLDKVFNDVGQRGTVWSVTFIWSHNKTLSISIRSLSVWGGVRSLLPECHAVLQLLSQSDGRPAEENPQQKPVSGSSCQKGGRTLGPGDTFPFSWLSRAPLPSTNVPRQPTSVRWTDPGL